MDDVGDFLEQHLGLGLGCNTVGNRAGRLFLRHFYAQAMLDEDETDDP